MWSSFPWFLTTLCSATNITTRCSLLISFLNQSDHQSDGTSWSIVRCQASSMPTTKVSFELIRTVGRLPNPFQDLCVPSRISALLLAFHAHTWVFGAAYYWLTWALLGKAASETCVNPFMTTNTDVCFRFPGCWSGSQHLGVVSARPSL